MDCNTPKQLPFSPERMIRGVDGSNSSRRHAKILQGSERHSFHGDARLFTFVTAFAYVQSFLPNSCLIFYEGLLVFPFFRRLFLKNNGTLGDGNRNRWNGNYR